MNTRAALLALDLVAVSTVGGSWASSVKNVDTIFWIVRFERRRTPLLQVGEITESNTCPEKECCVNFVLIVLAADAIVVEIVTVLHL
jgi:hypothetical protein